MAFVRDELKGQEAGLALIEKSMDYLRANNKPPPKSFYEQMQDRAKVEAEAKQAGAGNEAGKCCA